MGRKVAHGKIVRLRRKFVSIVDSDGRSYCAFLNRDVVNIIERYGRPDLSAFVTSCVLALSQVLGGPDRFAAALQWLAHDIKLGRRSTAIEVSIMYWASQHGIGIG